QVRRPEPDASIDALELRGRHLIAARQGRPGGRKRHWVVRCVTAAAIAGRAHEVLTAPGRWFLWRRDGGRIHRAARLERRGKAFDDPANQRVVLRRYGVTYRRA